MTPRGDLYVSVLIFCNDNTCLPFHSSRCPCAESLFGLINHPSHAASFIDSKKLHTIDESSDSMFRDCHISYVRWAPTINTIMFFFQVLDKVTNSRWEEGPPRDTRGRYIYLSPLHLTNTAVLKRNSFDIRRKNQRDILQRNACINTLYILYEKSWNINNCVSYWNIVWFMMIN